MRALNFAAPGICNLIESNHTASIADFSRCVKAPLAGRERDRQPRSAHRKAAPARLHQVCFTLSAIARSTSEEALATDLGPFIAGRRVDLGRAGADDLGIGGLGFVRVERLN